MANDGSDDSGGNSDPLAETYRVLREDEDEDEGENEGENGGSGLFEEAPSLAEMEELTQPIGLPPAAYSSSLVTGQSEADRLAAKAIFLLSIYPKLNQTMLHIGLGPHIPPREWKPVLDALIARGIVKREILNLLSPLGQYRSYTVISLTNPPEVRTAAA